MADTPSRIAGRHRAPSHRVPQALARRARRTAALGLLPLIALVACGDDDDEKDAGTTTTTEAPTSTSEETTTTTGTALRLVDPAETARAWIAEIGGGDDADAIALTSPRSLAAFGGEEGFRAREIELAEGWGAWDFAEDLDVTTVVIDDATAVVVLHGRVPQEGPPDESWAALPVVATPDGDRVEPFLDLGNVEVQPPAHTTIESSDRLSAYVLGNRDVHFVVDDRPAVEPSLQGADGDQQLAELDVEGLAPGLHALTVVLTNDDGVMARTFLYSVEG
jgi:hypothetical protein